MDAPPFVWNSREGGLGSLCSHKKDRVHSLRSLEALGEAPAGTAYRMARMLRGTRQGRWRELTLNESVVCRDCLHSEHEPGRPMSA